MNRLSKDRQEMILNLLVEGNTIRSIERITNTHRDTVGRLILRVAQNCYDHSVDTFRGLHCQNIECDEIWTYVGKKRKRVTENDSPEFGDQYVFIALDRDTKIIPTWAIGKRDSETAFWFMHRLARCIDGEFQLTTDQFPAYKDAVNSALGERVHYAMLRKIYHGDGSGREGYSPARLKGVNIKSIFGNPDPDRIGTSYIERQNLTIRTQMSRFTRLTNAFSKRLKNLRAALAVHFWHYNFLRVHSTLGTTPAKMAGVNHGLITWNTIL